ncbi:MAG TPA: helix-turn-helix transcriptional regulator [Phycisphaerae bacterium]|nr:helix-turn-helix transcriptional regulator [Phycisphaerae bacterium]
MPNILPSLNEHIRRLARREIRAQTSSTKRATAHYRRDIAALKRLVKTLTTRLAYVERHSVSQASSAGSVEEPQSNTRFRADGLRSHRARLELSAKDFGRLVGVSGLTIYNWESGKSRPRRRQLANLIAIRGIGKREAEKRLESTGKK